MNGSAIAAPILLLAGWAGQALLARPLTHGAEVRAARQLRAPPSALALRLAAGGVREAAADALWLTVLPSLGSPWAEPERKAAWIEATANALVDANPRALVPPLYASAFLERIEKRHPGIERVLVRTMEARRLRPFGRLERVNDGAWEPPHDLGMNLYLWGTPAERERALEWIRRAAEKPLCPTIMIDFFASLRAREGRPLDGWDLLRLRAGVADAPEYREYFLHEADRVRASVLQGWALDAERALGSFPKTLNEVLAHAPESERAALRSDRARYEAVAVGAVVRHEARQVEIPELADRIETEGRNRIRLLAREFEAKRGRPPLTLAEIEQECRARILPPPRHGTKWTFDAAAGEARAVDDPSDPRLHR